MFKDTNKTTRELMFAIKLSGRTTSISECELLDLFKTLKKRQPALFKYSSNYYNDDIKGGAIVDKKNDRRILVTPDSLEFRESKKFNKEAFNSICEDLYGFYAGTKRVEPKEIRLIGKVFNYSFLIEMNAVNLLKEKTGFLKNRTLFEFEIRTLFRKDDDHNIHLKISTKIPENELDIGEEIATDKVIVMLDINNKNQEDGLEADSLHKIIQFADKYNGESLLTDLNEYFN